MLKKSFLALSAEAKAKKPAPKPPAEKPLTEKKDPLKPLVTQRDLDKAPAAPKDTPKKPEPKKRRAQPAMGARGAAPKRTDLAPKSKGNPLDSALHAIDVGLGTVAAAGKTIPGTLMTPIHPGQTHTPVEDVKPVEWSEALAGPEEKKGKYRSVFGGTTDTPLKDQIAAIRAGSENGKLTKEQTKVLAAGIAQLPKLERTNVLAGIPRIQHFHLFEDDPGRRKDFLELHDLPEDLSDRQIIDALGRDEDGKAKGWNKLNPFNQGFSPADVLGSVGEHWVAPAFRDFITTPAKLGAGVLGASFAVGKSVGTGDSKYAKEALAEGTTGTKGAARGLLDMAAHPGKALQEDPIGTAVAVATLGDTAAGKVLSSRTLRGAKADRWVGQDRTLSLEHLGKASDQEKPLKVSKGPKSKKPLTRWLQDRLDEGQSSGLIPGADKVMAKSVNRDRTAAQAHADAALAPLIDEARQTARRHRITNSRQAEIAHTHGEGVTHAEMQAFYKTQHDHIDQVLKQDDELRKQREAESEGQERPQSESELHDLADHYEEQAAKARASAETKMERLSRGVRSKTSRTKLANEIHTAEQEALSWDRQAKAAREEAGEAPMPRRLLTKDERRNLKRVQKNVAGHRDWHDRPDAPLTAGEREYLDALRGVATHRTNIVREHGLSDESIMFRDNQTPIEVAAHDTANPLHGAATEILSMRDELRMLHEQHPGLKDGSAPEDIIAQAEEVVSDLNDRLHGFIEQHGGDAFRVPHAIPRQRNTFRGRGHNLSPRTDFPAMAGSLKGTTGMQLRSGHYVPSVDPLFQGAAKASRADANVTWVQNVLGNRSNGTVRVPKPHPGEEIRIGDLVQHPENFVLRNITNLRRAIDSRTNIDSKLEDMADATTATDLEAAYGESLVNADLKHDSYVPGDRANYVLVPKEVDKALVGGLTHRPHADALNSLYRANVLYSRPGFAFRNLTQAITTNMLEGVGPLSYLRAAKNDLPVAPGVENRGLAGQAARGDFEESHALPNLLRDIPFGDKSVSVKGLGKATVKLPVESIKVLTDTVRHLNREFENFARRAAYHKISLGQARQELGSSTAGFEGMAKRTHAKMQGVTDEVHSYLQEIADPKLANDPVKARAAQKKADHILDRIHAVQGDYIGMPDFPRAQLFVPFYRWYLFIGGLMLKMPFTHPVGNQFVQGLGAIGDQVRKNLGADLQDGNRSDSNIPIPGLSGHLNKATTINAEYHNPYTSGVDVVNHPQTLIPLFDTVISLVKGQDAYGNELVDQWGLPLDNRGRVENAVGTAASLFAPTKVTDSLLNPGPRSSNSLPVIDSKPRHQSLKQIRAAGAAETKRPHDNPLEAIFNWLTSAGLHEKNLTGENYDEAERQNKARIKRQTAENAAKRLGKK